MDSVVRTLTALFFGHLYQLVHREAVADDGAHFGPRPQVHHVGHELGHVLSGHKVGLSRTVAWNSRPAPFHVQYIDPWMKMRLPVWHTKVIEEPAVGDTRVFESALLEQINCLKCIPCKWADVDVPSQTNASARFDSKPVLFEPTLVAVACRSC